MLLKGIKRIFSKSPLSDSSDDSEEYSGSEEAYSSSEDDNPLTKAVSFIRDSFKKTPEVVSTPIAVPQNSQPNLLDKVIDGVRSISLSKTSDVETIHIDSAEFSKQIDMQEDQEAMRYKQSHAERAFLLRMMDSVGLSKKTEQPIERKPQPIDDTPQRLPSGVYLLKPKMSPEPRYRGELPKDFWTKIRYDPTISSSRDYERYMAAKAKRKAQKEQIKSTIRK